MATCFFTSDLHGKLRRYHKLFEQVRIEAPRALFLGGDLLPHPFDLSWAEGKNHVSFVQDFLIAGFVELRQSMGADYPAVYLILGNDDPRASEPALFDAETRGLWSYAHGRRHELDGIPVYGYACVPPTPFQLKDWERYDVSRHVDPGCISPEEGVRSVAVSGNGVRYGTIANDLEVLTGDEGLEQAIMLFHSPPYRSKLDRADLDGQLVDHVPLDPHIGSIAIQRFIAERHPAVTLHGHVHESARLTNSWCDRSGDTHLFGAAHDGPELALVRFDLGDLAKATRELL